MYAKSSSLASFEGLEYLVTIGVNFIVIAVSSFKGLYCLKSIGGDFEVRLPYSLESFEGLESLETIGGNFKIIDKDSYYTYKSYIKLISL